MMCAHVLKLKRIIRIRSSKWYRPSGLPLHHKQRTQLFCGAERLVQLCTQLGKPCEFWANRRFLPFVFITINATSIYSPTNVPIGLCPSSRAISHEFAFGLISQVAPKTESCILLMYNRNWSASTFTYVFLLTRYFVLIFNIFHGIVMRSVTLHYKNERFIFAVFF